MSVTDNIVDLKATLPENCTLVAVSKTKPSEAIQEVYNSGHRDFGENKVQELVEKAELLPKDIRWHMIGHLQRNKVKYIAPFVHLIHGIDSLKLLKEVNKQAEKNNRVIDCLLQIHIAKETTKFGLDKEDVNDLLKSDELIVLKNVKIVGLMGMATNTKDEDQVIHEFNELKKIFEELRPLSGTHDLEMTHLSMGMSSDYRLAIEAGSNMIRVGSKIFGERNYA
ncbi:MAG: YggS family pyridoxal phosphate-dependent enzyme [Cytophagales bacterium]|nr:YggS family pyridoxal phosphate-dependent enzyme [Cytophagales bacterium]